MRTIKLKNSDDKDVVFAMDQIVAAVSVPGPPGQVDVLLQGGHTVRIKGGMDQVQECLHGSDWVQVAEAVTPI